MDTKTVMLEQLPGDFKFSANEESVMKFWQEKNETTQTSLKILFIWEIKLIL